jgi:hypothetical protein
MTITPRLIWIGICILLVFGVQSSEASASDLQQVRLRPSQPQEYLELGEQLIAFANDEKLLRSARQILAMGVVVNDRAGDSSVAASCAIAIASTYTNDQPEYAQLWDLALLLDPARHLHWTINRPQKIMIESGSTAAEASALARYGDVSESRARFDQQAVRAALRNAAGLLGLDPDSSIRLLRDLTNSDNRDPCRGHYFDRVIEEGESRFEICPAHVVPLGTTERREAFADMVAVELVCLGGQDLIDDWGTSVAMHLNQPMTEPSINWLIAKYRINPATPSYDNGVWRSSS